MPSKTIRLLADANIPFVDSLFGQHTSISQKPGDKICAKDCKKADILLTRTITSVDESLLGNTPVKFVGSATAGLDHIDTRYLEQAKIKLADAKGANAIAVAQYIVSCVAYFYQRGAFSKNKKRAGVIGVGCCGSEVVKILNSIGFEVICHDPPRAERETGFISTPLEAFTDLDLICLHTPLTKTGSHPTYHLINSSFLKQQKSGCVLINAGRGAVIDPEPLLEADHLLVCLDVWDHEPNISLELLNQAVLATPHMAGYSEQAKARATYQIYEQARDFFNWPETDVTLPQPLQDTRPWDVRALSAFNPMDATQKMKRLFLTEKKDPAAHFESLRREYVSRQEYATQPDNKL